MQRAATKALPFIPDSGYAVDKIVIDGDTYLNDGNLNLAGYDADSKTYTFTNVQADRSIVVTFSADADSDGVPDKYDPAPSERYTVTARVNDGNGTITPVSKTVDAGDDVVFTITAYGGYALDYITVDGKVVYSNNDAENPFKDTWTLKNAGKQRSCGLLWRGSERRRRSRCADLPGPSRRGPVKTAPSAPAAPCW